MDHAGQEKQHLNINDFRTGFRPLPADTTLISNNSIYILTILIAIALKLYLRIAVHSDLIWVLFPTTKIVALFTGMRFLFDPLKGFKAVNDTIVISKECSGVNFFAISFCMVTFSFMRHIRKWKLATFFGLFAATWIVTFSVNASRIIIAITLKNLISSGILPAISWMHQAEGITVYFSFLVLYYLLIRSMFLKRRDTIESIF